MKFPKNLPGSDFLRVYEFAASYHVPLCCVNGVTCRGQSFFLNSYKPKMSRHISLKQQGVYSTVLRQMKAYNEEKCYLSIVTLYDLGVTQGQGQKCKMFSV